MDNSWHFNAIWWQKLTVENSGYFCKFGQTIRCPEFIGHPFKIRLICLWRFFCLATKLNPVKSFISIQVATFFRKTDNRSNLVGFILTCVCSVTLSYTRLKIAWMLNAACFDARLSDYICSFFPDPQLRSVSRSRDFPVQVRNKLVKKKNAEASEKTQAIYPLSFLFFLGLLVHPLATADRAAWRLSFARELQTSVDFRATAVQKPG